MQTHYRAFADLWVIILIKIPKCLKKARICDKSACVHYGRTGVYNPIFQEMHVQGGGGYIYIFSQKDLLCEMRPFVWNAAKLRTISAVQAACGPSPQLRPFMEALEMGQPGKSERAPGDSAYMRGWSIGDTHLNGMVPHFFHHILDKI